MCQYFSAQEMEECSKNPNFCVVCLCNRDDVKVEEHVCEECQQGVYDTPRKLQRVTLDNGETYFIDERLKQLRNVENPHDFIDF